MTIEHDAVINHAAQGRNRKDRVDVTFTIQKNGRPFQMEGCCWTAEEGMDWVGSLLLGSQGKTLRLRVVEKPWTWKIVWASKIETPVVRPFAVVR